MSFNEMSDRLKGAESRETRVRLLAENLFRRGLVMTMASARQMAESMVDTERKVQQRFEEQKPTATHYPSTAQRDIPLASKGFLHPEEGRPRSEYADLSALKENTQRLRERAANPRPVDVQTHYETPRNGGNAKAVAPRGEELSAADFVDLKPDMLVSDAVESPVAPRSAPSETPASSVSAASLIDEETAEDDDFIELTPAPEADDSSAVEGADEPLLELEEDAPGAPGQDAEEEFAAAADESVPSPEDSSEYVTLGEEAEHETEPGDEELGGGNDEEPAEPKADGASATPPAAEPAAHERAEESAPEEPPAAPEKPRENLAKKYGVDLGSIFNVNK